MTLAKLWNFGTKLMTLPHTVRNVAFIGKIYKTQCMISLFQKLWPSAHVRVFIFPHIFVIDPFEKILS